MPAVGILARLGPPRAQSPVPGPLLALQSLAGPPVRGAGDQPGGEQALPSPPSNWDTPGLVNRRDRRLIGPPIPPLPLYKAASFLL